MEVYEQIKADIIAYCILFLIFLSIYNTIGIGLDNTDKDGFNRSGVTLVTDYGTGLQYLARDGALVPRLDASGKHMRIRVRND